MNGGPPTRSEIVRTRRNNRSCTDMRLESIVIVPFNTVPKDFDRVVGETSLKSDVEDSSRTGDSSAKKE